MQGYYADRSYSEGGTAHRQCWRATLIVFASDYLAALRIDQVSSRASDTGHSFVVVVIAFGWIISYPSLNSEPGIWTAVKKNAHSERVGDNLGRSNPLSPFHPGTRTTMGRCVASALIQIKSSEVRCLHHFTEAAYFSASARSYTGQHISCASRSMKRYGRSFEDRMKIHDVCAGGDRCG